MAFPRNTVFRPTWAWALAASFTLAACGGGGGGGSSSGTGSTALPAVYAINQPSPNADGTYDLAVVDTANKVLVKTINVTDWYNLRTSYSVNANTGDMTTMGVGDLYYLQAGKVYKLDLSGSTLGAATQVSSLSNVCSFNNAASSIELAPDGKHSWVRVGMPDNANTTCANSTLGLERLVSYNMGPTDTAVSGLTVVRVLTNTQKVSTGILVSSTSGATTRLDVYTDDLKTVKSVGFALTANQLPLAFLTVSPTNAQQAYVQTGTTVQFLDWSSGTLVDTPLGGTALPLSSTASANVAKDASHVYLAQNGNVYAIGLGATGTVQLFASASSSLGNIAKITNATSKLLVYQNPVVSGTTGNTTYTVSAVDKTTKTVSAPFTGAFVTDPYATGSGESVVWAVNGDSMLTVEPDPNNAPSMMLIQTDLVGGISKTVAQYIDVIYGTFKSSTSTLLGTATTNLMWAGVSPSGDDLLYGYSIPAATAPIFLGTLPLANATADFDFTNGVAKSANLIKTTGTSTSNTGVVSYYQFDINTGGSLVKVGP